MMQLSLMRGFAHNLTLFGGLQSAAQYHNLSLGAGQGLGEAGALSLQLLNARDRHQQDPIDGRAWQLQYSKGFDRLGTQFTFTGWRYSHQRYATLSEAYSSPIPTPTRGITTTKKQPCKSPPARACRTISPSI